MRRASPLAAATLLVPAMIGSPVPAQTHEEKTTIGVEVGRITIDARSFDSDAT